MAEFDKAIGGTLQYEGYYADVPGDRGGRTYAGITEKNHPTWPGWGILDKLKPKHNQHIPELDLLVKNFYRRYYWDAISLDKICNDKVAAFIFDWYVHSGKIAVKKLQKIVGVDDDGIVGKQTIVAVNNYDSGLFEKLRIERMGFLRGIVQNDPSQAKFLKGWTKRVEGFSIV